MSDFPKVLTFFLEAEVSYFKNFKNFAGGVEAAILMHIMIKHSAIANPFCLKYSDLIKESGFQPVELEKSVRQLARKEIVKWTIANGEDLWEVNLDKIASFVTSNR